MLKSIGIFLQRVEDHPGKVLISLALRLENNRAKLLSNPRKCISLSWTFAMVFRHINFSLDWHFVFVS